MTDKQLIVEALAGIVDAMKRLEKAIESDNLDDRAQYVWEASERRKTAEKLIREKLL